MSVLVQGEGQQLLLTKGAPESVLGRCSSALANAEPPPSGGNAAMGTGIATSGRQVVPLTEGMRRSLLERMGQYGGAWLPGMLNTPFQAPYYVLCAYSTSYVAKYAQNARPSRQSPRTGQRL
jgi:hypothetical protein